MTVVRLSLLASVAAALSGCLTGALDRARLDSFDLPESDAILIDWQECAAAAPCMRGDWEGQDYALGFKESPAVVSGSFGGKAVEMQLDRASVYSYGNKVIEMTFLDRKTKTVLAVTWNEQDQRLIDAQLVQSE